MRTYIVEESDLTYNRKLTYSEIAGMWNSIKDIDNEYLTILDTGIVFDDEYMFESEYYELDIIHSVCEYLKTINVTLEGSIIVQLSDNDCNDMRITVENNVITYQEEKRYWSNEKTYNGAQS